MSSTKKGRKEIREKLGEVRMIWGEDVMLTDKVDQVMRAVAGSSEAGLELAHFGRSASLGQLGTRDYRLSQ